MLQGKPRQKKLKPMKQPTKPARTLLTVNKNTEQPLQHSYKDSVQKFKVPPSMVPSKPEEQKISTLENVCTDLLASGNVQSFIDLFYITHKCLPNMMTKKNYFGEELHIHEQPAEISEDTLHLYRDLGDSLMKAEVRPEFLAQEKEAPLNEYNTMAYNYEEQGDYVTACYFYNRVVDIAISCKNKQFELVALLGLGKCFDQENKKDEAIELLENAFDDASVLENEDQRSQMTKLIGKQLIEIYLKKAAECERFDLVQGLQAYESALEIAKRAKELQDEACISHRIGQLYYQEEKYTESVANQQNYLAILKQIEEESLDKVQVNAYGEKKDNTQEIKNFKFKQMEAHASLAKCYLKLKEIENAELHLNDYHKMAKEAKAQNSVADSSYYLAKLFEEKGEKDKAITFYQSYFEAAKSEKPDKKDRRLVDKARVTFAIAKANKNMQKYISIFNEQDSLKKLLDWKIKRVLK